MTGRMPVEDFDSATNNPDFAQEWLLPLSYNLAIMVAPKFGVTIDQMFAITARELLDDVIGFDTEHDSVTFGLSG